MNSPKLNKTLKGFALAFGLAFGLILMTSVDASAQDRDRRDRDGRDGRDDYQYDNNRDYRNDDFRHNGSDRRENQFLRAAYQRGYLNGLRQGMNDARSRRWGKSNYNAGYFGNGRDRNNGRIQRAFQAGFQRGYQEGFSRGRNNGRNNGRYNNFPY